MRVPRGLRAAATYATAVAVVLASGGCGVPRPALNQPASPSASTTPGAVSVAVTTASASVVADGPPLCSAPRPAQLTPFPFNRDAARRDAMVGAGLSPIQKGYVGGVADFYGIDAQGLAVLIEEKFIDPYDRQNSAPTVWDIFQFLCRHPRVTASGYVVSLDRPDYRTSIDDIAAPGMDAELRADAQAFCVDAETEFEGHLECFWD